MWESVFERAFPLQPYGDYGAMLRHGPMVRAFPKVAAALLSLHTLRLESFTAHPRARGGAPMPRRLRHKDFERIKAWLGGAVEELANFSDRL